MVHCGNIRQTASIVSMDKDLIRTGDRTLARFRFVKTPEYMHEGARLVFRFVPSFFLAPNAPSPTHQLTMFSFLSPYLPCSEGRTKAVGTVTKLIFAAETEDGPAEDAAAEAAIPRKAAKNKPPNRPPKAV